MLLYLPSSTVSVPILIPSVVWVKRSHTSSITIHTHVHSCSLNSTIENVHTLHVHRRYTCMYTGGIHVNVHVGRIYCTLYSAECACMYTHPQSSESQTLQSSSPHARNIIHNPHTTQTATIILAANQCILIYVCGLCNCTC